MSKRPLAHCVFVGEIGIPIVDVVDLINNQMRREGFVQDCGIRDAVTHFEKCAASCWRLETATEDIAEKICYMNKMDYKDNILRIHLDRHDKRRGSPRFSCWNDYHLHKYGKNCPVKDVQVFATCKRNIGGDQLALGLNQKMRDFGLYKGDEKVIKKWRELTPRSYILEMISPQEATHLCYLNHIHVETTQVVLERPLDWHGPPSKYETYMVYLKSKSSQAEQQEKPLQQQQSPKKRPPPTQEVIEIADSDDDDETSEDYARELRENKRLKEDLKLGRENSRLKQVLAKLSRSNSAKLKETESLKKELASLTDQVALRDDRLNELRIEENDLSAKLSTKQQQVDEVHASWKEQFMQLAGKRDEISSLQEKIQGLQQHTQNVTESLLEEQRERKLVENVLAQVQAKYEQTKQNLASVKVQDESSLFDV